jgi:sulfur transfer protein SufE
MSEEIFLKAKALVNDWEGKENWNVPAHVITEMFNTHNQIWPDKRENSKSCSGCRARVWSKIKDWYHGNKHLYNSET